MSHMILSLFLVMSRCFTLGIHVFVYINCQVFLFISSIYFIASCFLVLSHPIDFFLSYVLVSKVIINNLFIYSHSTFVSLSFYKILSFVMI